MSVPHETYCLSRNKYLWMVLIFFRLLAEERISTKLVHLQGYSPHKLIQSHVNLQDVHSEISTV